MQTISFYSYKGGTGRSLLVANTARFLSLSGLRVIALDLDFEAPGLHYKLRDSDALVAASDGMLKGAVDYLIDALENDTPPPSLEPYTIIIPTPPGIQGSIRMLPAGCAPHPSYWALLGRLGAVRREQEAEGTLALALLDLVARVEEELRADYLLIDARTGVTELGGLATTALADRVVCLSLPNDECLDGTRAVVAALGRAERPLGRARPMVEVLLSRAGKSSKQRVEELNRRIGEVAKPYVLHHDEKSVEHEQLLGSGHIAERRSSLLAETIEWMERTFPMVGRGAASAARRMRAIDDLVDVLTQERRRPTPSHEGGRRWWPEQIQDGVTFTTSKGQRFADLALYVDENAPAGATPDMIIEYVGSAAPKPIAAWWLGRVGARAVCLILDTGEEHRDFNMELFTDRCRDGVTTYRGQLPSAEDFRALDDVADRSHEARIKAISRGHRGYTHQLVRDWALSTEATVHGGMPWRPDHARAIQDAFVVGGEHLFVLGGAWLCDEHMGVGSSGRALADRVSKDLLAPVWWRTDLEKACGFDSEHRHDDGQQIAVHAFVATRLMGLRYDPDDQFRHDAGALFRLERHGKKRDYLDYKPFQALEITYDLNASLPETFVRDVIQRFNLSPAEKEAPPLDPGTLIRALCARSLLATVGVLGMYDPESSKLRFYRAHITAAAEVLGTPQRALERIVHMHLAVLAYAHLGRDADGRMWETFALPREIGHVVQPGSDLTTIAQYFVYRFLERLDDRELRDAFQRLSDVQPVPYRRWKALVDVPIEDVRAWLMTMRRGSSSADVARLAMLVRDSETRSS